MDAAPLLQLKNVLRLYIRLSNSLILSCC
jgi:hypothetical protein